jgi:chromosome segregation ATPase
MSSAADEFARSRTKTSELEKANQALQNQTELVKKEFSHKTSILEQKNTELSDLQTQYKQVLQKLVQLSQRPTAADLSSAEKGLYHLQFKA